MNFWETITGSDLTREWKAFEARAEALPADYRAAWEQIKVHLFSYSGFTGRNVMPIFDSVLGLLEETAADGVHQRGTRHGREVTPVVVVPVGVSLV